MVLLAPLADGEVVVNPNGFEVLKLYSAGSHGLSRMSLRGELAPSYVCTAENDFVKHIRSRRCSRIVRCTT